MEKPWGVRLSLQDERQQTETLWEALERRQQVAGPSSAAEKPAELPLACQPLPALGNWPAGAMSAPLAEPSRPALARASDHARPEFWTGACLLAAKPPEHWPAGKLPACCALELPALVCEHLQAPSSPPWRVRRRKTSMWKCQHQGRMEVNRNQPRQAHPHILLATPGAFHVGALVW